MTVFFDQSRYVRLNIGRRLGMLVRYVGRSHNTLQILFAILHERTLYTPHRFDLVTHPEYYYEWIFQPHFISFNLKLNLS